MSNYAPLPQSNIDSDSEEELHTHHLVQRDESPKDFGIAISGFSDQSPIIISRSLSATRRIFFILSIFTCFITIIGFVWLIPCNVNPCIGDQSSDIGAKSWETPINDLELYGPIEIVKGNKYSREKNIVLLARRVVTAPQPLRHQLLCLLGSDGTLAWRNMLALEPKDLDCSILDANEDGVKDCLVSGSKDLLKVIEPLSGMDIWSLDSTTPNVLRTQRSLLIPDITDDSVPDLLTSRLFPKYSDFLLISGATGEIIGNPVPSALCDEMFELVFEKDLSVSYTCISTEKGKSEQTIDLNKIIKLAKWTQNASLTTSGFAPPQSTTPDASIEARVSGKRLLVKNRGHCPTDCRAVIVIKDSNNHTLYDHSMDNVYGMAPVTLSFDRLTGFVIKLWQWKGNKHLSNTSDTSFHWGDIDGNWIQVTERVLLMTFNDTGVTRANVHVVNVSQQNLVQLCQHCTPTGCNCQPDALASRRSLLIADLDADGSRELVSYTSSFTAVENEAKLNRRLEARVRVVRFQAELPLLYQSFEKPS